MHTQAFQKPTPGRCDVPKKMPAGEARAVTCWRKKTQLVPEMWILVKQVSTLWTALAGDPEAPRFMDIAPITLALRAFHS
jgi:hypothetical protein